MRASVRRERVMTGGPSQMSLNVSSEAFRQVPPGRAGRRRAAAWEVEVLQALVRTSRRNPVPERGDIALQRVGFARECAGAQCLPKSEERAEVDSIGINGVQRAEARKAGQAFAGASARCAGHEGSPSWRQSNFGGLQHWGHICSLNRREQAGAQIAPGLVRKAQGSGIEAVQGLPN